MVLTALIMAGGKATRMHGIVEKPLLEVGGKPMIQHVHDALRRSQFVNRIVTATSESTSKTAAWALQNGVEVIETPGSGYEADMKYAIKKLGLHNVLVVSADLPFIKTPIIERAVREYIASGKQALTVMAPLSVFKKLHLNPTYVFEVQGKSLVPIGVNIVDGSKIDEPDLDEIVIVTDSEELALNVNTPTELVKARSRAKLSRRLGDEQAQ